MVDTNVTFLSCYNTVGHTRMYVMALTSPPSLPLSGPWAGLSMRRFVVAPPDSRIVAPLSLTLFPHRLLDVQKFDAQSRESPSYVGKTLRVEFFGRLALVFPTSLGSCPDTQVMTLASSPPSSRRLPFRVCQTLLSPCPGFPALPVISSLIRGALEF